jgi:hypothetical protein
MTAGTALRCPVCHARLESLAWHGNDGGRCLRCFRDFDFQGFPALTKAPDAVRPQAAVPAVDSVCFFHPENRAETVCDDCGRFLCPVCQIEDGDRRLCPACIAKSRRGEGIDGIRQRTLYDNMALVLAIGPLIIWPFTLVGAPICLGMVAWGWRRPGSLVRGRHWRFAVATALAVAQVVGWVTLFVYLAHRRRH